MSKYICEKACFYRDRLWSKGETIVPAKGEKLPKHFVPFTGAAVVEEKEPEDPKTLTELAKQDAKQMLNSVGRGEQAPQEPAPVKKGGKKKASEEMFG